MPQFLLEILSEEIPARLQTRAAADLKRLVCSGLSLKGLIVTEQAYAFVTPRRLVLMITDLPILAPLMRKERRGPHIDAPKSSIEGFLKENAITLTQAKTRQTPKGTFYFVLTEQKGGMTATLLQQVVESTLADFPWPRSMRWGNTRERWVRPIRRILCIFNKVIVPVRFAGMSASNMSEGHKFLAPEEFPVCEFHCYEQSLRKAYVILDSAERVKSIRQQAQKIAVAEGLTVREDDSLLSEIAGLVEWPVVLLGSIDKENMKIPKEVISIIMRNYQKLLVLLDFNKNISSKFIIVSNVKTSDNCQSIINNNEKVLQARLADAKFFWEQDCCKPLRHWGNKLTERIFHARLGTLADKVRRMRELASGVAQYVPKAEIALVDQAIVLAKADLSTGMVGEFPELQGTMGRYYAWKDGEVPEVCNAIAEHYLPLGQRDSCPSAPVSVCVALADRIDTLVGFWTINEKPTGSKDPFALRRAVLSGMRLILENGLRIPLLAIFRKSAALYHSSETFDAFSLLRFFTDRLKTHLQEKSVRHDLVAAVLSSGQDDDLVRLRSRVYALVNFIDTQDGMNLLVAHRRAISIVRIEKEKNGLTYNEPVDVTLLGESAECALEAQLVAVAKICNDAIKAEQFHYAMQALSQLRVPIDRFFNTVTINSNNSRLKENRLRLLSHIGTVMGTVADFAKIEG